MKKLFKKMPVGTVLAIVYLLSAMAAPAATVIHQFQNGFGQSTTPTISLTPLTVPLQQSNTLIIGGMTTFPWPTNGLSTDTWGNVTFFGWTNNGVNYQFIIPLSAGTWQENWQGFPGSQQLTVPNSTNTFYVTDLSAHNIILQPAPITIATSNILALIAANADSNGAAAAIGTTTATSFSNQANAYAGNGSALTQLNWNNITGKAQVLTNQAPGYVFSNLTIFANPNFTPANQLNDLSFTNYATGDILSFYFQKSLGANGNLNGFQVSSYNAVTGKSAGVSFFTNGTIQLFDSTGGGIIISNGMIIGNGGGLTSVNAASLGGLPPSIFALTNQFIVLNTNLVNFCARLADKSAQDRVLAMSMAFGTNLPANSDVVAFDASYNFVTNGNGSGIYGHSYYASNFVSDWFGWGARANGSQLFMPMGTECSNCLIAVAFDLPCDSTPFTGLGNFLAGIVNTNTSDQIAFSVGRGNNTSIFSSTGNTQFGNAHSNSLSPMVGVAGAYSYAAYSDKGRGRMLFFLQISNRQVVAACDGFPSEMGDGNGNTPSFTPLIVAPGTGTSSLNTFLLGGSISATAGSSQNCGNIPLQARLFAAGCFPGIGFTTNFYDTVITAFAKLEKNQTLTLWPNDSRSVPAVYTILGVDTNCQPWVTEAVLWADEHLWQNRSVGGTALSDIIANPFVVFGHLPQGVRLRVFLDNMGWNDIFFGASAATTFSRLQTVIALCQTNGAFEIDYSPPMYTSTTNSAYNTTFSNSLVTFDEMVRTSNLPVVKHRGDLAANQGTLNNPNIFGDGQHASGISFFYFKAQAVYYKGEYPTLKLMDGSITYGGLSGVTNFFLQ
ncbi:MAG TPA: hypothetical protein VK742_20485 [Candidatus Sulfotelmatobacter sp.]|jgi:hypothetical protein|nr:hypothetical protein [Candidatus Sulfotelmatobacter sp.]